MSCMTIPEAVADIRNNITILRMARPPALSTNNVLAQLCKFANNVEQAYERLSAAHKRELIGGSKETGICSEERSMISPAYARNFIADFILGKPCSDKVFQQQ